MSKINLNLGAVLKGLPLLLLCAGATMLSSCDDDGLTAGDPNYFTSSRGQFTATLEDGTILYLVPGPTAGTALVTYDGDNPRHWQGETSATVRVGTYQNDMVIPEEVVVDGVTYTIVGIGDEAFTGCREYYVDTKGVRNYSWYGLKTIQLPETITSLGKGAFAICTNLTSVNIPLGVKEIPMGCFATCTALTTFAIPETVNTIGDMAFYGDVRLKRVDIAEGVESIGEMAFFDCRSTDFTSIEIPSTVTRIGNRAFGGRGVTYNSNGVPTDWRTHIAEFHVKAMTPPTLEGVLFEAADGVEPVVYVPAGALSAYQSAPGWSSLNIEEE